MIILNKTAIVAILCFVTIHSSTAQVATIPFDFKGKQLFIPLQAPNGKQLRFIFDTGATGAMIDSISAKEADLYDGPREKVSVAGSGGAKSYQMIFNREIKIQDLTIDKINFVLAGFKCLAVLVGDTFDGIIGYEILSRYVTRMDFEKKQVVFYENMNDLDTTGFVSIPFEFSKNILIPRFPISITLANGQKFIGKVMFDTGNASTLLVSTPFSKYHQFDQKLGATRITTGAGVHAETTDQLANIKFMSFDGFKFGPMGIRLTVNPAAEPKDGYLGILGIEIIKRFHVILDYAHQKIFLKPNRFYGSELPIESLKDKGPSKKPGK